MEVAEHAAKEMEARASDDRMLVAKEKAAKDKAENDAAEHAAKEHADMEKTANDKVEKESAEKAVIEAAAKERTAQEKAGKASIQVTYEKPAEKPSITITHAIADSAPPKPTTEIIVEKATSTKPAGSTELKMEKVVVEKPVTSEAAIEIAVDRSVSGRPVAITAKPSPARTVHVVVKDPKHEQAGFECAIEVEGNEVSVTRARFYHRFLHRMKPPRRRQQRYVEWNGKRVIDEEVQHSAKATPRLRERLRSRVLGAGSLGFLIGRTRATVVRPSMEESAQKSDRRAGQKSLGDMRRGLVTRAHEMRENFHRKQADLHTAFALHAEKAEFDEAARHHVRKAEYHAGRQLAHAERHLRGRKRYAYQEDHAAEQHMSKREHHRGRWLEVEERHRNASKNYEDKRKDAERYLREARRRLEERLEHDKRKLEEKGIRIRQHMSNRSSSSTRGTSADS